MRLAGGTEIDRGHRVHLTEPVTELVEIAVIERPVAEIARVEYRVEQQHNARVGLTRHQTALVRFRRLGEKILRCLIDRGDPLLIERSCLNRGHKAQRDQQASKKPAHFSLAASAAALAWRSGKKQARQGR